MEDRPLLNRGLEGLGTTIFAEMSALAAATGSINLGQGFPDTDGPAEIARGGGRASSTAAATSTPRAPASPSCGTAIAEHQQRFYGLDYDPDTEVLVTAGATEAIAAAMLALLEPGDEVIAFEPFYDSYSACIAMAGAVRVPLTLRAPDFRPDLDGLRSLITPRTRLLLLNTPHNPTGMVLTGEESAAIARLAVEHDLLVVIDEVYEHLVFAPAAHPARRPAGHARAHRLHLLLRQDLLLHRLEGRLGDGAAPALVAAVRTAKQYLTYVSAGPFQYAIAEALRLPDTYFADLRADLQRKRDLLAAGLRDAGFEVFRPQGTYFITTDITPLGEKDAFAFCRALPGRCGVVAIPNSVFYDDPDAGRTQVRFTFCKKDEVLHEAAARLKGVSAP